MISLNLHSRPLLTPPPPLPHPPHLTSYLTYLTTPPHHHLPPITPKRLSFIFNKERCARARLFLHLTSSYLHQNSLRLTSPHHLNSTQLTLSYFPPSPYLTSRDLPFIIHHQNPQTRFFTHLCSPRAHPDHHTYLQSTPPTPQTSPYFTHLTLPSYQLPQTTIRHHNHLF